MSFFKELKRRNVVRVGLAYVLIAWVVLQIIDFLLELTDAPSWVLQVFFITAAVGLPVALVFSWVYEMTPEGIKLEKDIVRHDSIAPTTGRKLDRLIIAALGVVVALLIASRFIPGGESSLPVHEANQAPTPASETADEPTIPSIAVLPFVNMSSDPEQEYFSDGISEEILNSLARVDGLKVAGRTSSFSFKGRNVDLREIGEALGVENILEGSVRKQGDQVRITAQLIQVEDGFHLWSDTFDRKLDDIFAIQDEIANAILQETRSQLLEDEKISSTRYDPIAYQNYIAAKQRIHERTKGGLEVAMALLKDALELDPEFASAWAQLAIATMLSSDGFGSYGDIPDKEAQLLGWEYLNRGLEIDPDNAEVHAGFGLFWSNEPPYSVVENNKAVEHLELALAADPGLTNAQHWMQRTIQGLGRDQESIEILENLVQKDPLYWPAVSNLVFLYVRQNRLDEATALNNRTMRYRPELPFRQNALILSAQGKDAEALVLAREVWNDRQDALIYSSIGSALFGLHQYQEAVDLEGAPDSNLRAFGLAYLGRTEEALMVANTAMSEFGDPSPMITTLTLSGRYEELVQFIESKWESPVIFQEQIPRWRGYGYSDLINIALAYRESGKDERFKETMAVIREQHDLEYAAGFDTFWLDMNEACYWAMAGDDERAMSFIDSALNKGFGYTPRFSKLFPHMKPLEGLPRYEAQQSRALAQINEQRALASLSPIEAEY